MEIFPVVSLLAEALAIVVAASIALKRKKAYGWLFAASYALFLVNDAVNFLGIAADKTLMEAVLLFGVAFSLVAVWQLYKEK